MRIINLTDVGGNDTRIELGHTDCCGYKMFKPSKITRVWFNKKMPSYQHRKFHCGDKTVVRSSYLHNWIIYTNKMVSLYPSDNGLIWNNCWINVEWFLGDKFYWSFLSKYTSFISPGALENVLVKMAGVFCRTQYVNPSVLLIGTTKRRVVGLHKGERPWNLPDINWLSKATHLTMIFH